MSVGQSLEDMRSLNIEDLRKIGSAPVGVRIFVVLLVVVAVCGLGTHFFIVPKMEELERTEARELELRQIFDTEQGKAANLSAYKEQLAEMRRSFGVMLRQLPNKTDIESLLIDLSQTSVAAGLEVEFFKPEQEVPKEFYAEHPIKLSVTGRYHEFGDFVSGLAALPRIVTLHDIAITPNQEVPGTLRMNLTATTYRYLEEDEG